MAYDKAAPAAPRALINSGRVETSEASHPEVLWSMRTIAGSPDILMDKADTPSEVKNVIPAFKKLAKSRHTVILVAIESTQDHAQIMKLLAKVPVRGLVITQVGDQATPPTTLATEWTRCHPMSTSLIYTNPKTALHKAVDMVRPNGLLIVCGSTALVEEYLQEISQHPELNAPIERLSATVGVTANPFGVL